MRVMWLGVVLVFTMNFSALTCSSQNSVATGGSNIAGSGGSASFTVGQVFFCAHAGATGEVFQGVQIPYEISVVTSVDDAREINLNLWVYPNPATDYLTLSIKGFDHCGMVFYLFDISGRIIQSADIKEDETLISVSNLSPQVYFVKVMKGGRELKTFKIVKR